jgi:hypothetical protein
MEAVAAGAGGSGTRRGWATQARATSVAHDLIEMTSATADEPTCRTRCGQLSSASGWRPAEAHVPRCTRCQCLSSDAVERLPDDLGPATA